MAAGLLAAVAIGAGAAGIRMLNAGAAVTAADFGAVAAAPGPVPASRARPAAPIRPAARPGPVAGRPPRPRSQPLPAGTVPTRLSIPDGRVTAAIVPVGVGAGGRLDLPRSPATVGWWSASAPVGARSGGTVLAGHVDSASAGVGALAALRTVAPGDRITVTDQFGGRHAYIVTARRTYPKQALPAAVFRISGPARLVLITCGGPFDDTTRSYRDNIVVYAQPATAPS